MYIGVVYIHIMFSCINWCTGMQLICMIVYCHCFLHLPRISAAYSTKTLQFSMGFPSFFLIVSLFYSSNNISSLRPPSRSFSRHWPRCNGRNAEPCVWLSITRSPLHDVTRLATMGLGSDTSHADLVCNVSRCTRTLSKFLPSDQVPFFYHLKN